VFSPNRRYDHRARYATESDKKAFALDFVRTSSKLVSNATLQWKIWSTEKLDGRTLKPKSFSKKSLSLARRMPKPPMTPDDINALSKAWNESKAATDAVLAKFREGASKDEIDDAIRKMYATRGKVQEFHDKFFEN
jgi:Xaa-Pro aminopeptidase